MPVSIIIPTFNRNDILHKSLSELVKITAGLKVEIIVINDSKTNEPNVDAFKDMVRVVKNTGSGVASARNFGAKLATYENIIFIDDDIVIDHASLLYITTFLDEHPDCCVNIDWVYPMELQEKIRKTKFGRYLLYNGHADLEGWMGKDKWRKESNYPINGLTSQLLGITKKVFNSVGGYNEAFPLAGFEDHDFSTRIIASGTKVFLNTHLVAYHNEEDRVGMFQWLERRGRNGETRAIGVTKFGYESHRLTYSPIKNFLFGLIYVFRKLYAFNLYLIPNLTFLDRIYAKLFNPMLGAYIHHGYKKGLKG